MSNGAKFAILAVIVVVVGIGGCALSGISFHNKDVSLRNAIKASQDDNQEEFDAMWKIIKQQANVAGEYGDQFKDIYAGIMDGRYANDNAQAGGMINFKMIKEDNPDFDSTLLIKVQDTIESQRTSFKVKRKELRDHAQNHKTFLETFPNVLWAGLLGRESIAIKTITSAKTERTFETGKDDDINLFDKE